VPGTLVSSFIAAIEANDLDSAVAMVADDIEYDNVPMRTIRGKAEFRASLQPFLDATAEIEWVINHQVASGTPVEGVVMNERLDRFLVGDRWIEIPVAGLFVIRDGLIALWRDYFDLATFQSQMSP
jgi:limonene-1,2-epoxide hydrolase